MPWLRSEHRLALVAEYLNSPAGRGKRAALEAAYARALAKVPERLYGSHPDLTIEALGAWAGNYPVEYGGGA
jgi:hypothetical protein